MIRLAAIACCALLLGACEATSYKVAPTTQKAASKIATAQRTVQHASKRAVSIEGKTKTTQIEAGKTGEHIAAALKALAEKDYVTAAQEMIAAGGSNQLVDELLKQSLADMKELNEDFGTIAQDLREANDKLAEVDKTIEKMAIQGAKDRAVVEQGEWGWGAGYFIVGIKRILSHAFWGTLILVVVVIILLAIGGPVAVFTLRGLKGIWSLLRKKRSD